jgi:hypothetical protein
MDGERQGVINEMRSPSNQGLIGLPWYPLGRRYLTVLPETSMLGALGGTGFFV